MSNREDVPYIVVEKDSSGTLGSFVLGALVGAGVALLLAPQSGKETQDEIKARAQRLKETAGEKLIEAQQELEARLETVRGGVQERVERVKEAVDSGVDAARAARSDLEDRLERSKAAYRAGIEAAKEAAAGSDEEAGESA